MHKYHPYHLLVQCYSVFERPISQGAGISCNVNNLVRLSCGGSHQKSHWASVRNTAVRLRCCHILSLSFQIQLLPPLWHMLQSRREWDCNRESENNYWWWAWLRWCFKSATPTPVPFLPSTSPIVQPSKHQASHANDSWLWHWKSIKLQFFWPGFLSTWTSKPSPDDWLDYFVGHLFWAGAFRLVP